MKILTILLLMISTQVLAENITVSIDDGEYKEALGIGTTAPGGRTVEQCNQIANISKRTIKAAISGVPITEVINKFTQGARPHQTGEALLLPAVQAVGDYGRHHIVDTQQADEYSLNANTDTAEKVDGEEKDKDHVRVTSLSTFGITGNPLFSDMLKNDSIKSRVTAIYKTVNQIKMKHSQVREQDRVRLNNRVEQKLIECRAAFTGGGGVNDLLGDD